MAGAQLTESRIDLAAWNRQLEGEDAQAIVSWAVQTFEDGLVMTTSFGVQSAVMLHLVTQVVPGIPVIWIDTGFNFPETYRFADDLIKRLKVNLKVHQADMSPARMVALHGRLWEQGKAGLDQYDRIRKIEPRDRAFGELNVRAWLTGPRREQTDFRSTLRRVERLGDIVKIHPIRDWTGRQVEEYLERHDLPYHPLHERGYASVGDWHSTTATAGDDYQRSGRFQGLKQECGLHLPQSEAESASRDSSGL